MKNICTAMAGAFKEIEAATKSAENAAFKQGGKVSRYADLGAVIDAVKPALINHELFFTQHPQPSEQGVTVETVLHHSSGEQISMGTLFVPANKKDAHGFGSALTYARRYGLMTAFGVPAEDDDGNAASRSVANGSGAITDEQVATLQGYANSGVIDAQRFCKFFQIGSFPELPAARWNEAMGMAKAKAERAAPKPDPTPEKNPVLEPAK